MLTNHYWTYRTIGLAASGFLIGILALGMIAVAALLPVFAQGQVIEQQSQPLTEMIQVQPEQADPGTIKNLNVQPSSGLSKSPVERVVAAGLMKGYPDGKFHPEGNVTRAELAHLVVKTFKVASRQPQQPFDASQMADVSTTHWAYSDIQTALKADVMEGYRPGRFYPNQVVTRAEAFAIFAQAYGVFNFDAQQIQSELAPYRDASAIPAWADKAIATALHEGFINTDKSTGYFYPNKPMTRGDMAYALSKYLERTYSEFPNQTNKTTGQ